MSIFNRWRTPPPPPPIYRRQPLATAALVFTIVGTLILGPVGYLWNGMAEELKSVKVENKETRGAIVQNQLAIKELLTRQQMIIAPKEITVPNQIYKKPVPPELYNNYMDLTGERKQGYKTYLEGLGYDTRGLPD